MKIEAVIRKIKQYWPLFLLLLISLPPLWDFFHPGVPLTHDIEVHIARIASFYQSLSEGHLIPRWAGNLNWGYGHPILMFVYPLPSYFASLFHFLGFSLVESSKIIFILSFVFSGIFMYLWIKEIWGETAGFIAGISYLFAPYRFVDLYVRGALGETVAFVFPPLILYFLLKLSKKNSLWYVIGGSLSSAALILSHNMLSLIFSPIIFSYIIYLIYLSRQKLLTTCYLLVTTVFGFSLSAFFWLPAFFEGKYTLRDIVTKGNITGFESFSRLLWSPWHYGGTGSFSVQLGIFQWLGILLAPLLIWQFWQKKDKIWLFLSFIFLLFWTAIFLILPASKSFYSAFPLLQKWQFAWRFLSLAIFPPAVFLAGMVYLLPKQVKVLAIGGFLILALLFNKDFWHAQSFLLKPEVFYSGIYPGTTDTGESSPLWSVRFMEQEPSSHLEVINGQTEFKEVSRISTRHEYEIEVKRESRLKDNTLYFPGWQVLVDGQRVEVEYQDPNHRGLITFVVPEGKHQLTIVFVETKLRNFANFVSLLTLVILAAISFSRVVRRLRICYD